MLPRSRLVFAAAKDALRGALDAAEVLAVDAAWVSGHAALQGGGCFRGRCAALEALCSAPLGGGSSTVADAVDWRTAVRTGVGGDAGATRAATSLAVAVVKRAGFEAADAAALCVDCLESEVRSVREGACERLVPALLKLDASYV